MTLSRWLLLPSLLALALVMQAGSHTAEPASAEPLADYVPGELLVGVRPGTPQPLNAAGPVPGARAVDRLDDPDVVRIDLPPDTEVSEAIEAYEQAPWVEYAEPNYYVHATITPNDTFYAGYQSWYYNLINGPSAWNETTGDTSLIVGIVDTGMDVSHEDLDSKDVPGTAFISSPTDDPEFCPNPHPPGDYNDDNGHGTMVSGMIGAESNNGQGVSGTAWGAKLMPVKALDCNGAGTSWDAADGILYAAQNGADVINLSLTGPRISGPTAPCGNYWNSKINTAVDTYGAVVVAASGNDNTGEVGCPAAHPKVIAVGASGGQSTPDARAGFSNWGPEIDVAAPGVNITSTSVGGYAYGSGTSFATPIVSGLAALILSQNPSYDAEGVRAVLCATAVNLPDGSTPNWDGCGRVDMAEAVAVAGSCPGPAFGDYDGDGLGDECDTVDDLKITHWAMQSVQALYDSDITNGCYFSPPLEKYCPGSFASRAEIAVLIINIMGEDPVASPTGVFSDVPPSHWAAGYIEKLYQLNIAGGCATSPLQFCPSAYVTRAEMAKLILNAIGHGDSGHLSPYQGYFTDVAAGLWYTAFVEHLYDPHAITGGCSVSPLKFCPGNKVTRAELAVFIARAWNLLPSP